MQPNALGRFFARPTLGRKTVSILLNLALVFSIFATLGSFPRTVHAAATVDTFTRAQNTNANGYGVWTVPAGVTQADVACWGGGGGGGDGNNTGGGGGGGGAFASSTVSSLVAGTAYTIFIGAGGATTTTDTG